MRFFGGPQIQDRIELPVTLSHLALTMAVSRQLKVVNNRKAISGPVDPEVALCHPILITDKAGLTIFQAGRPNAAPSTVYECEKKPSYGSGTLNTLKALCKSSESR